MKRNKDEAKHSIDGEMVHTAEQLHAGLEQLDRLYPVNPPNLEWFQQMTVAEKKRLRRKLMFDLVIFMSIAVVLLSVYFIALKLLPVIYLIVTQGIVAIWPIIILLKKGWRSSDEPYGQ